MTTTLAAPLTREQLIARYEGRAPRYTSYPTAVQFTPAVDAAQYRRWLAELPADEAVSLYVHIPMCARLCWYCACNTRAVNGHRTIAEYVRLLTQEIALVRDALPARMRARAVHLGGGTPNMLDADDLAVLFGALREAFAFEPGLEIAAELDPEVLTRDWVEAAVRQGLSRVSLGVQNLSPEVQAAVNRPERFEHLAECLHWLRLFGIESVNLDLMYGLPRQTVANTLSTIEGVLRLRPERIALFGYAHVPWMKSHQKLIDEAALPGPAERLDQAEAAAERLMRAGYARIGLDHFALPLDELTLARRDGRLHRNFQGYTTDTSRTLLGLGASAIGSLPQGFAQNIAQELPWRAAVAKGELPVARGVAVTADDRFRGEIIERLMCDLAVDLEAVCRRHGRDRAELAPEVARLAGFEADGLIAWPAGKLTVTEAGRVLVRSVCAVFDAYVQPQAERHSRTI